MWISFLAVSRGNIVSLRRFFVTFHVWLARCNPSASPRVRKSSPKERNFYFLRFITISLELSRR
jgi:hypothetical protein